MKSHIGIERSATVQRADVFAHMNPRTPQNRQYAQYTPANNHTHVASDMAVPFLSPAYRLRRSSRLTPRERSSGNAEARHDFRGVAHAFVLDQRVVAKMLREGR